MRGAALLAGLAAIAGWGCSTPLPTLPPAPAPRDEPAPPAPPAPGVPSGPGRTVEAGPRDGGMQGPPAPREDSLAGDGRTWRRAGRPPTAGAKSLRSTAWDDLRPGEYEAHLQYRDPRDRPRRGSDEVGRQPPRIRTGTLRTEALPPTAEALRR